MVVVTGTLFCSDGTEIPVLNASMTNSTSAEVQTNAAFSVVAMSVGTFAQNKTIIASTMMAGSNNVAWAYLLRRGQIMQVYYGGLAGRGSQGRIPTFNQITLEAGDQLHALPVAAATRTISLSCITAQGNSHIFTALPSGAATNTLTSIITGNGIGSTFQGQTIVKAFCSSVDGIKLTSGGGCYVVDDKGTVVGAVQATDTNHLLASPSLVNIPIALNYAGQAITSS